MADTSSLVEALYNNFLLRDLFAKIVPGSTVLTAVLYDNAFGDGLVSVAHPIGWPAVLVFAGLAWIVGFAVQDLGEVLRIIRHHPRTFDESDARYELRIAFQKAATNSESQQAERYAIIKEASGNGATAIFLGVAIVAIRSSVQADLQSPLSSLLPGLLLLVLAGGLLHANRTHAEKQYNFIKKVVGGKNS